MLLALTPLSPLTQKKKEEEVYLPNLEPCGIFDRLLLDDILLTCTIATMLLL